MNTDRLPPHDDIAERAVIGAAIQEPGLAPELRPEWFYNLCYRQTAITLLALASEGKPIDPMTLTQRLTAEDLSEANTLVNECLEECHSSANFEYWGEILTEKLVLRSIVKTAQEASEKVLLGNGGTQLEELLSDYERKVLNIRQKCKGQGEFETDIRATLLELQSDYEQAATQGKPRGLATGFCDLDAIIGGLEYQQFFVIAARPSVGKTSLGLGIAENLAIDGGLPVGFFSLEMSTKEMLHRLSCSRAHVDGSRLRDGSATKKEIKAVSVAHTEIVRAPLRICDRGGITVAQLAAYGRRMVQQHKIKLLIVDYLGLLRSGERNRSRYEETTLVSNALKTLAKELNIPVIALAQLNRDNDKQVREPRLSDLRDSGAIEQDADIVGLLHPDEDQTGDDWLVKIIIAKHRSGRTGKVDLLFRRQFTRFENTAPLQKRTPRTNP